MVAVKALACELPHENDLPLSRLSGEDIRREAVRRGIAADISGATVWRWLHEDAIRPWTFRSWVFPRDPHFAAKAGPILDLYESRWKGEPLSDGDFVLCADEKPSIQARRRVYPPTPPAPRRAMRVEHEYVREGGMHLHRRLGRPPRQGVRLLRAPFLDQPLRRARRRRDGASSLPPRPTRLLDRRQRIHPSRPALRRSLPGQWPNARVLHTPVHASWLNQVEVYFSIVPAQGARAKRLPQRRAESNDACSTSSVTTRTSPGPSSGSSPGATSTAC